MPETLSGWEFSYGGLFDAVPEDGVIHLIRQVGHGTPGASLCGRARFGVISPGGGWKPLDRERRKPYRSNLGGQPVGICRECMFALEGGIELHTATATPAAQGDWDARGMSFAARKVLAGAR